MKFTTRALLTIAAGIWGFAPGLPSGPAAALAGGYDCGDLDENGMVVASDAQRLLRFAVGQPVTIACPAIDSSVTDALDARLDTLEPAVATLTDKTTCLSRNGTDTYFTGCNVHVINGSGETNGLLNGLGNLIIGYNEDQDPPNDRSGIHNLVIGPDHTFPSYGGLVAGRRNTIAEGNSSVTGGIDNVASGDASSVTGGESNSATGARASVSGGYSNVASGLDASVTAGEKNEASGQSASVTGGEGNNAKAFEGSITGGFANIASETGGTVVGGTGNEASGTDSAVLGGTGNTASGYDSTIGGGKKNTADNTSASVSGGYGNTASGVASSVSGGSSNDAQGSNSSISGGYQHVTLGDLDWKAGGLFQDF